MPSVFRSDTVVRREMEAFFPGLTNSRWSIKSPFNDTYQCVAWAACRTDRRWWPTDISLQAYWPPGAPVEETVAAFCGAFAILGYRKCDRSDFEVGYQKVAIYALSNGHVTHMARQHFWGRGWLSKPGNLEDILHSDLGSIEGNPAPMSNEYGKVVQILKRSWWDALLSLCLLRCLWNAAKFYIYRLAHKEATPLG